MLVTQWLMTREVDAVSEQLIDSGEWQSRDQFIETGFPAPVGKGNSVQFMSGENGHLRGKYLQIGINSILFLMPTPS